MDWFLQDGLQDVELCRMFSFQEVEFCKGEVVWREVRRALEAGAADGRVLDIGVLGRLKDCVNQVSDKLIFSDWVGRHAVVDDRGRKPVQGSSIDDVETESQHEGHNDSHCHGSLQDADHQNAQVDHGEEELPKKAFATALSGRGRSIAVEATPGRDHLGAVEMVGVVGKAGPVASAGVEG